MSRYHPPFAHWLIPGLAALGLAFAVPTSAGVITVDGTTYRLDGGKPETGAWEIAEKLAVSKDAAVVVMEKKADQTTIQIMLQMLETLHVPTVLTKRADFQPLVDRGVLKPTHTQP